MIELKKVGEYLKSSGKEIDQEDYLRKQVEWTNASEGDIQGFRCERCKNKGFVATVHNEEEKYVECECMAKRRAEKYIEKSGIKETMERMTFDTFEEKQVWQKNVKDTAKKFIESDARMFFVGGQSGSGKTHIGTAVAGFYLRKGVRTQYIKWRTEVGKLKRNVNEDYYEQRMKELANVPVLYIDDLLKSQSGKDFTQADAQVAWELIDSRNQKGKKTIVSSEYTLEELVDLEDSLAGRIFEQSQSEFAISIPKGMQHNLRLKAVK